MRETLGLKRGAALAEQATVEREGTSLRVTLRSNDGRVLGDRTLAGEGSCAELAGVVAVVLSAWLSDVHPEFVGSLPEAAPKAPTPPPAQPAPDAKPDTAKARRGALGAAFGADFAAGGPAFMATLGLRWLPVRSGLGAAASAAVIGLRTQQLSSGNVRYWRWPLMLGPAYRIPIAASKLDLQAGAALSWLHLEGSGFTPSTTQNAFSGGGFFSTRVSAASEGFEPFGELGGMLFPATKAFVLHGSEQVAVELPHVEVYVAFGASLRAW